jgi:hypothetical protein
VVLGVTEHGVSVLHEAEAPPVEEPAEQASVTPIQFPSFESLLSRTQWTAPGKRSRHVINR